MKDFLSKLREKNIYLSLAGGDLSVKYPTGEIDRTILEEIRTRKNDLVNYLSSLGTKSYSGIQSIEKRTDYALSSAQKRLWILGQFEDANAAYNVPTVCVFEGELNVRALETAFRDLIGRHEILRTIFRQNGEGEVRQYIREPGERLFSIDYNDLSKKGGIDPDDTEQESVVNNFVRREVSRPFVLSEGPLLRVNLLRVGEQKYILVYVIHHIISDGWSTGVMLKELLILYNEYIQGKHNPLPPLKTQYKDYAAWQNDHLSGERLSRHRAYWMNCFEGELPVLEMPADHRRPAKKTYNGDVVNKRIDRSLVKRLKSILQSEEATLFMGLLGILNVLLYRYTGQEDIIIGSPVAGRDHIDLEDQVGFYVNMLALRVRLKGHNSYRQLLENVKEVTLGAYQHQVYPFDQLVGDLQLNGDLSRHPLFDIVLVLQNMDPAGMPAQRMGNIQVKGYDNAKRKVSLFDMRLEFQEVDEDLLFVLEYNSDLFGRETVRRFGDNFENLIRVITAQPDMPLERLDYISESEKQILLDEDSPVDFPRDKTIVQCFMEQAERTPGNIAVAFQDRKIRYKELNERANQVAHFLLNEVKFQPGERAALLMDRNPDCIVAILGILKAGGTYMPMETDMPEERLKFMLNDAGVRVLLTGRSCIETANRLQWACKSLGSYLCMDTDDLFAEKEKKENVMMSRELWDHVGEKATDQITGGGWSSSFTGQAISFEEMEEYAMNVYNKVSHLLNENSRILEIGCSSGLTLNKIAPGVGLYYGTDLSPVIIENTRLLVRDRGLSNVKLENIAAHEISSIEERDFDLIVINSVIQHFHGHNYLRQVIKDSIGLLKNTGSIFIGDVMDIERKDELIADLEFFKEAGKGMGYTTKTDFSADLFVSRDFFKDLIPDIKGIVAVEASEKIYTIENELTKYRYDVVLKIEKHHAEPAGGIKSKTQFDNRVLERQSSDNPSVRVKPEDTAYVIFTSGTTGRPKGVLVQHYNVVRLFWTDRMLFDFSEKDVWTMFHSYSFDFSVWEMYGALFFGGKLVLVPKSTAQDASVFLTLLKEQGVTILNQTPSSFYNLSDEELGLAEHTLKLRYVIFGGEALSPAKLKEWADLYPDTKLINMYGITETTVHVTYKEISAADIVNNGKSIGKAIPTLTCYVLDQHQNFVPIGVPGELYIGGAGLAKGYLNREELTKERFVRNPFDGNDRLYRSGDKVKLSANGELEYLGRADHQVKIRGYRIELGEVENVILKDTRISEARVIAREEREGGGKYLAAYIVANVDPDSKELKNYLHRHLPDYMVPAHIVRIERLPLTSNGKVNLKLLPDPLDAGLAAEDDYIAPRNEMEKRLVQIWEEILVRERISVSDDFFELGGHSLKAMQLKTRIAKALQIQIELRDIFRHGRLSDLADLLSGSKTFSYRFIPKAEDRESYPLSHAQRRFWILDQFDESAVAYNIAGFLRVEGDLDKELIENAFKYVISRHESLRTVFRKNEEGEVRQHILDDSAVNFRVDFVDISHVDNQTELLKNLFTKEQLTRFDLENGPLLRIRLIKIREGVHGFLYGMHHIFGDGWSMEVLTRELTEVYNCYRKGDAPDLVPLRIQYKDYAAWQDSPLSSDMVQKEESYWLDRLSGELPVTELAADRPRPANKSHRGNNLLKILSAETTQLLRATCAMEGATLFMGLSAGLKALLYCYTGQEDIIVGSPVAGRADSELERQIGVYINTLALRTQFKGADSFRELLRIEKEVLLGAYAHQLYPFDRLIDKLRVKRDMSRSPLFDIWIVLQNQATLNIRQHSKVFDGVSIFQMEEMQSDTSQFDLAFIFSESGDEIHLNLIYSVDLYNKETIESLYKHFIQLLTEVSNAPDRPLNGVSCLTETEKDILLGTFNNTEKRFQEEKTVIDLFEEQAGKSPDNIALIYENRQVTYGELKRQADQISNRLKSKYNIKSGDIIGIMQGRSEGMIAGLLGILKSGAAYVPIDPDYPWERIGYMTENAKVKIIILARGGRNGLEEHFKGQIFSLDDVSATDSYELSEVKPRGNDLAYVIYTSGSTGYPKGCLISHKNLSNYIRWANEYYFDESDDGNWGLVTPISFDLTVTSIYTALTRGKKLYIGSAKKEIDELLEDAFNHGQIDTLKLTPSHLSLLPGLKIGPTAVRRIIVGGEQLNPDQVKILKDIDERIRIFNEYGPTETTVGCIVKEIEAEDQKILIGKPISNAEINILNRDNQLCPVGVPGEIWIGGAGVSSGYLSNETLTEQKFTKDPLRPGRKMYKTGDIGRWTASGDIEYMGRSDDQVKIRGYRIEPGEIERVFLSCGQIDEAIVTVKGEKSCKYLVAYLVSKEAPDLEAFKVYVAKYLPGYMIPQHLIWINKVPLTKHGKIDRNALPDPAEPSEVTSYIAPRDELETELVKIWEEILKKQRIGIEDNFFEMGGQSLQAVRLSSRIQQVIGFRTGLKEIFLHPTIRQFRHFISRGMAFDQTSSQVQIFEGKTDARLNNVFFLPPASGLSFCYLDLLQEWRKCINGYLLQYRSIFDEEPIFERIEDIIQDFLVIIQRYASADRPIYLVGYSSGGNIGFETAKHLEIAGYKVIVFIIDAQPKLAFEEPIKDKASFLSTFFPDLAETRRKALSINLDESALQRYLEAAYRFHMLWPDYAPLMEKIQADLYVFANMKNKENLGGYEKWKEHTSGNFGLIMLEEGEHTDLLKYRRNIEVIRRVMTGTF